MTGVQTCALPISGHLLRGYFSPRVTAAVTQVERALARQTTRLVAVGEQVRNDLLQAGVGRAMQFTVVPPGISVPAPPERRVARRMLGVDADAEVVAFVARLTAVKRPDRMLEAMQIVCETRPRAVVLVCGEGDLLHETVRLASGLGSRIRFLGWRSDVETVYGAADVALLTSDNEGTPVSLIEAGMCGIPAVSTGVGSVNEVVSHGETGFVTGMDATELAQAVSTLLDNQELRSSFSMTARIKTEAAYGCSRLVTDMESVYEDVVQETQALRRR